MKCLLGSSWTIMNNFLQPILMKIILSVHHALLWRKITRSWRPSILNMPVKIWSISLQTNWCTKTSSIQHFFFMNKFAFSTSHWKNNQQKETKNFGQLLPFTQNGASLMTWKLFRDYLSGCCPNWAPKGPENYFQTWIWHLLWWIFNNYGCYEPRGSKVLLTQYSWLLSLRNAFCPKKLGRSARGWYCVG